MKKNKEPQNVEHVRKMVKKYKEFYKGIRWMACIVCGDLCPQSNTDERYRDLDTVHLTCRYDTSYYARSRELKKQREEEAKVSLF